MSWVNPAGGAWDVASNWSTGAVPGPADDVTIDTVAAITITSQFSAISVNSLTTGANDALSFSYGNSLTVAGASTLNGSLAMIGGSLTASGPAASLTANGPTTMSGTNLFAKNGGVLSLPQLPSAGVDLNSINASGVGSVVDLSALTGLAQTGSLSVVAAQGGKIKLGALASLSLDDDNNLTLEADGSGSLLDLSGLTSLAETKSGFAIVGQWNISASHAGETNLSSLQSLSRAQVASYSNLISLNDTTGGEILDGELASLNGIDAILDGTDMQAASSWTSFTSGSLFLTAGTYALPGLSDIDRSSVIVQNGASLSLPGVTSYAPSSRLTFGTPIEVDGAASVLDLPALSSVSISNQPMETLVLKATNGGKLSLAALKSLSAPGVEPRGVQIVDTGASTLLTPLLTSLNGVGVTFDGSDPQAADSWTQFVGGSLKLTGGAFSLPGLTDIDGSILMLSGGARLALPNVVSDTGSGRFSVDGVGSVLDLSGLTNITATGSWSIGATNGGSINLIGVSELSNAPNPGGLPYFFSLIDTGGSTILASNLATLSGATATLDGSDPFVANSWTRFVNGSLNISGGSYSLGGLTDFDGSSIHLSAGGKLALPGLSSFESGQDLNKSSTFQVDNASLLDLSSLTTLTQKGTWNFEINLGGEAILNGLTTLAGSKGINFFDSGRLVDDNLTSLDGVYMQLSGDDAQAAQNWTSLTNGSLQVVGGNVTLPNLTNVTGAGLSANVGILHLPGVTSYTIVSGSAYPAPEALFSAYGAGSLLDLSALTKLTQQKGGLSVRVTNGGTVDLTGLTSLSSSGPGQLQILFNGDGTIRDDNLSTFDGVNVTLDHASAEVAQPWRAFVNGQLFVLGGSFNLPGLTDLDGTSLNLQSGAVLALPGLTSYAANNTTFSVLGQGSVLDLSALAQATGQQGAWSLNASSGGIMKLTGMHSLVNANSALFQVYISGNGTIVDDNLTSLDGIDVRLDGSNTQAAAPWTSLTHGSLTVTGRSVSLPGLTDVDGSNLYVSGGGSLALPGLTHYAPTGTFEADGAGSLLDVSALANVGPQGAWTLNATNGGAIRLTGLTQISGDGSGSLSIAFKGDGTIADDHLTTLDRVTVSLQGASAIAASSWHALTNGGLDVTAGDYTLPALTNVDGTYFNISNGGRLSLPSVTSYAAAVAFFTVNVSGTGSVLNLPALTTLTHPTVTGFDVESGGDLKLPRLTKLNGGDKPMLVVERNGTIEDGSLTDIDSVHFNLDGSDPQIANAWVKLTNGGIGLSGGVCNLPNLQDADNSGFSASNGALLTLPAVSSFHGTNSVLWVGNGGSIVLDGQTVFMPSAGSRLTVNIPQLAFDAPVSLVSTGTFDNTTFNIAQGEDVLIQSGAFAGSTIFNVAQNATLDLTGGENVTYSGTLSGAGQGKVRLANGGVTVGAGGLSLDFPDKMFQWTGGGFNASAGAVTNKESLDLAGAGLTISGNFKNSGSLTLGPASSLAVDGNFTQTAAGELNEQIGGAPASGQFGQIAVQGQADLAGALNLSLVNGFASSDNQDYKVLSFAAAHGNFSSTSGLAPNFTEQFNPTSIDLATAIPTPYQKYVAAVYEDVLGRAPDSGGLAYWVKQLTGGASISSLAASIAHSDEYYANFVIKPDYLKLLGRAADDGSVTYWTAKMQAGLTDQQFEAGLIASDEFYKAAENFDSAPDADDTTIADTDQNTDWVDAVYKLLLGRTADSGGEAYWTKQLAAGVSRGDVALSIANGAENNTQLINADYFHYLGRAADPDGLNYWLEQFAAGKTNEDVIAGFTGSLEYYEKHTN